MIKLSIIIPYYNAKEYTDELLDCLSPQLTDEIEVILVDDGSTEPFETPYEWCHVIRKQNGGCSTARNMGLDNAKGEYIFFLDADDLVAKDFIKRVFDTIDKEQPDVIEFSLKSLSKDVRSMIENSRVLLTDFLTLPYAQGFSRSHLSEIQDSTRKKIPLRMKISPVRSATLIRRIILSVL